MYNYFMIIGTVANATEDSIGIDTPEGNIKVGITPILTSLDIKIGQRIGVAGSIHPDGLYARKIMLLEYREVNENERERKD